MKKLLWPKTRKLKQTNKKTNSYIIRLVSHQAKFGFFAHEEIKLVTKRLKFQAAP